ncbi:UDP-N-acetylmuramate--L-alanine ligase [Georgenia sp. Z1344]|uniref:UDP-N-acetylmuramate--L-alanine ligase n=1 Tax=Georgenia sp. Z1344 TaxID=3416706 RepID=UPI003CE973A5
MAETRAFHLVGIGGAGMSVVAHLLLARGARVSGSDAKDSAVLAALADAGADVHVGHDAAHVPDGATVVVSTAVRETNPELAHARATGLPVLHRSEALQLVAEDLDLVAVAGAHGKTTTSAMLAVALRGAGLDPSYAIGGSVVGVGPGAHLGGGTTFVAEADESDGSFLNYAPRISVVTNIEVDHIDHWGSAEAFHAAFEEFADRIRPGGLLVACADDDGARRLATTAAARGARVVTYGTTGAVEGAEAHVALRVGEPSVDGARGGVEVAGRSAALELAVGGVHNLRNAAACVAVAVELGVDLADAAAALGEFRGTGRRFEPRGEAGGVRVVDDYAHHPTEVAATLAAARVAADGGRVLVLFQPHLFSRTRAFAAEFAAALSAADLAVVTDVFASREDPEPGVDGSLVTARMSDGRFVADRHEAAREIAAAARPGDLVLTMGAGDVTELGPVVLDHLGART